MNTFPALVEGMKVKILKGCAAYGLVKGTILQIRTVTALGADYSHQVKVTLQPLNGFKTDKVFAFYARHPNRLSDMVVRMNDGNPMKTIEVTRK